MTKRSEGYARLDALIAEHGGGATGESWLLSAFVSRIAECQSPQTVAIGLGLPWFVLRGWLEDSPERMRGWALGKRCCGDGLEYAGIDEARNATVEEVQVAKLRCDVYGKTAGKMNRDEWGDKQQVEVSGDGLVSLKELLRMRDERIAARAMMGVSGVVIDQVAGVLVGDMDVGVGDMEYGVV